MLTVIIVLGLLVLSLLFLAIWNFKTFKSIKSINAPPDEIKEARYWELHYKMDYLVAVAAMGAAVLVFLGYESLQGAKDAVKSEINDELITVRDDISKTKVDLKYLKSFSDSVNTEVSLSEVQISGQLRTVNELERKINDINNRTIVQQEFYVVRSLLLLYDHDKIPGSNKVHFKTLSTDDGDRLPEFSKPPLVIPISQSNVEIMIFNIKYDSFEAYWGGASLSGEFPDTIRYSVVIIGK